MKKLLACAFFLLTSCSQDTVIEFLNKPCLVPYHGHDFTLCKDFRLIENNEPFTVPEGFVTDLASVPRILWPLYAPNDTKTIGAAIMHDYLYACPSGRSRSSIDSMFYSALITGRNSTLTALFYWFGVRIFGSPHFREGYQCVYQSYPSKTQDDETQE